MGVFGAIQEEFKRMIKTEDELDEELDEEREDYDDDYDQSYADDGYDDEEEEEAPQRTSRFSFGFGGKSRKRESRSYGYDAEEEQQEEEPAPAAAPGSGYGAGRDYSSRDYSASASRPGAASAGRSYSGASASGSRAKRSNVVDFNAGEQQQVKVVRPKKFQDGTEYAECLRANQTIVMNLEETPEDVQRRVTDFVCGAAFALGGKVKGVNKTTLVATPYTMDIVGDKINGLLNNELEN